MAKNYQRGGGYHARAIHLANAGTCHRAEKGNSQGYTNLTTVGFVQ